MKKHQAFKTVSVLAASSFVLAACSSGGGSGGNESSDDTITVWTMTDGLDEFVQEYEDESGTTVEVQAIPWENAHDKIVTAVASGDGPDVLQVGTTWVAEFADAGTFKDLSDYTDEYDNLSSDNFYDTAVETTKYEDQTIGVPWYVDTRALFYRTDILEDAGYPDGPKTWDDMVDASEQLTARGDDQYAIDLLADDPQFPFVMAWEQGWDYDLDKGAENFDDPAFQEAIELHHTFYDEGYSQLGEGKEFFQAFADGSKPMFISGPWDIQTIEERTPEIEGDWDVTLMPEAETNDSMMGGAHWTVFNNSEKTEEALDFINWMSAPETQVKWYEDHSELPANLEAWEDPVLKDDDKISTFGEQLEHTKPLPLVPEYEQMGQELLSTLEQINRNDADIDKSLDEYQQEVSRILGE
ncbi:sugar ABC transporter substrate-binding protein [uncultured Marinococcus sp.]|uniref:sugar ABC transporter substrate-binding protein n=1 Tax=uncultured Marinococcus sp. TaxID=487012 RepID=UPI00260BAEC0|nr:sugar ABC transporter substrate-binding protein [uncultured Marinococcus sp.]